jgi:hypothetical protein
MFFCSDAIPRLISLARFIIFFLQKLWGRFPTCPAAGRWGGLETCPTIFLLPGRRSRHERFLSGCPKSLTVVFSESVTRAVTSAAFPICLLLQLRSIPLASLTRPTSTFHFYPVT